MHLWPIFKDTLDNPCLFHNFFWAFHSTGYVKHFRWRVRRSSTGSSPTILPWATATTTGLMAPTTTPPTTTPPTPPSRRSFPSENLVLQSPYRGTPQTLRGRKSMMVTWKIQSYSGIDIGCRHREITSVWYCRNQRFRTPTVNLELRVSTPASQN